MDKSEKREQRRFKDKHRPRGTPKFLVLMLEQWNRRDKEKAEK